MKQNGRKSATAVASITATASALAPLRSPAGLSPAERSVWMATVNAKPADYFGTEHVPMLVDYVRHVCRGHVIDEQIKGFDVESMATADGLKRYEKLTNLAVKIALLIKVLATAMRLTHAAVYATKASALENKPKGKLWQRDERRAA